MLTPAVFEDMAVMKQAASKLYFGQVRASRELSQVLLDTASREKRNQAIADLERNIALDEALVGRIERARQNANASLRLGGEPWYGFGTDRRCRSCQQNRGEVDESNL
jgi:hypothetical protein